MLITLYLVAMLVGQPLAGRLCDVLGARRLATIAATGFGVFSAAAMFAGSFWLLVALRALQAAFASALVPSVQAMLREVVPASQRGRAFGVQGSVLGVGAGLGPVIGGLATAAFGWRAIFGVNLPVVLVVLYVLQRRVAPSAGASVHRTSDVPDDSGRLFNGVFGVAFSTQALSTLAQYALLLAVPIVLDSRGWSAASIGVALSSLTLGMVVMGPYGGRLGDAHGRRRPVVLGLAVTLVAVAASAVGGDDVPSALLVLTLLLFGLGLGVATPSVMTAGHRGRTAGARRVGGRPALGQPLRGQHRVHPRAGGCRARRRLRSGDAADRLRGQPGGVPGGGAPAPRAARQRRDDRQAVSSFPPEPVTRTVSRRTQPSTSARSAIVMPGARARRRRR